MHSRAGEVADGRFAVTVPAEDYYQSACLILAEKAARSAADHNYRLLVLVLFHMNTGTVARIVLNIDLTASHGIACGVADTSVNDDFSVVHSVSDCVLSVAPDGDLGTVEISAESVAGNTVDNNLAVSETVGNKSLSETADYFTIAVRAFYHLVESREIKPFCFYLHIISHLLFYFKVFEQIFLFSGV